MLWSGFLARSTGKGGGGASYIILPSASRFEAWIRVGYLHIPSQWVTIASCRREIQNSGAHCPMLMTPVMFPKPIPSPPNPCHAVTLTVLQYRHHTVAFVQSAGKIYDSEPCDIGMDLPLSSNVRVSSLNVNCIQDGGGTRWRHKPEGCGFDSRWCHWNFFSGRTVARDLNQPIREMSTRNISWGVKAAGA